MRGKGRRTVDIILLICAGVDLPKPRGCTVRPGIKTLENDSEYVIARNVGDGLFQTGDGRDVISDFGNQRMSS